jgi:hypothetical protein
MGERLLDPRVGSSDFQCGGHVTGQVPHNNGMQRTALRAAADAERWTAD